MGKLAGISENDNPPVMPLPVDPADPSRDIYQGNQSFPPVDGQDIWPSLIGETQFASRQIWLSAEVLIRGQYKLLVAQPDPKKMNAGSEFDGWKTPNGTKINAADSQWPCNVFKNRSHLIPCLFDLSTDPREEHNIAPKHHKLVQELWTQLNRTQLTAYKSRSPSKLLGMCNTKCAKEKWGGAPGPVCGVPGCDSSVEGEEALLVV